MNTPLQQLGQINRQTEAKQQTREFAALCKFLMLARGDTKRAAKMAREAGPYAGPRATLMLEISLAEVSHRGLRQKAAVDPGATLSSTWGSPLSVFESVSTAFLTSLAATSLFDAMWPSMLQLPLRTHVASTTTAITG